MDANPFDDLFRAFARTPSRRAVTRALSGLAFGGVLGSLAVVGTDAKRNKKEKKRRRRRKRQRKKEQPFCAGKNFCAGDASACGTTSIGFACRCLVAAEAGDPFCAEAWTPTLTCDGCGPGETCVALAGAGDCEDGDACAVPCANPF